mmetsp:Transcript_12618/g.25260  ORF Transcript_12618/g.25260 Transcript_12618/m.25260 type:complete len:241 (-) Transcript_12618:687-1409(-)
MIAETAGPGGQVLQLRTGHRLAVEVVARHLPHGRGHDMRPAPGGANGAGDLYDFGRRNWLHALGAVHARGRRGVYRTIRERLARGGVAEVTVGVVGHAQNMRHLVFGHIHIIIDHSLQVPMPPGQPLPDLFQTEMDAPRDGPIVLVRVAAHRHRQRLARPVAERIGFRVDLPVRTAHVHDDVRLLHPLFHVLPRHLPEIHVPAPRRPVGRLHQPVRIDQQRTGHRHHVQCAPEKRPEPRQ